MVGDVVVDGRQCGRELTRGCPYCLGFKDPVLLAMVALVFLAMVALVFLAMVALVLGCSCPAVVDGRRWVGDGRSCPSMSSSSSLVNVAELMIRAVDEDWANR